MYIHKHLLQAWRTTMRPRPSREWVISELERLGVRLVSGRKEKDELGTEGQDDDHFFDGDDDDDDTFTESAHQPSNFPKAGLVSERPDNLLFREDSLASFPRVGLSSERPDNLQFREDSITSTLLSAIDVERDRPMDDSKRDGVPQRRNASSGIALLDAGDLAGKDAASSSKSYQSQDHQALPPAHRPLVGGGAAAAYEVARADHYMKLAAQKKATANVTSGSRAPFGPLMTDGTQRGERPPPLMEQSLPIPSLSGKKSQASSDVHHHYEMLKIHHMNLLKEIQETTIMMNIFQQQMLAQQQEKMHEDLLKQQLLQQQLKQKQQFALSTMSAQQFDVDNPAYKQVAKFKQTAHDFYRTNAPADNARMMSASSSTTHGLKESSSGTDFAFQGNTNSSSANIKQAKKARKSNPNPNNHMTGEEESHRAQRMKLEHLKAEILEKQALLAAMSQGIGPTQVPETAIRERPVALNENGDQQNSNTDLMEKTPLMQEL
jgi:hypothetical protein